MDDGSHNHWHTGRRETLRTIGGAAATVSLSGCLGILGEKERDVSLEPTNWITPSSIDRAVASGYADFSSIYRSVN